jgi:hypothetical protein
MLRRLVEKVESGELEAMGGQAGRLLRSWLEAATAWEDQPRRKGRRGRSSGL